MTKMRTSRKAFTLVEVMIVVAIIALLITIGVPGFLRSRNKAWRDTCVNNLRMIEHAADQYRIENNLTTATDAKIVWLWPINSTLKDVSSYVNKQLTCPQGGFYRGGVEITNAIQADIDANGRPHCATEAGGTIKMNAGLEFEHSIEKVDS